MLDVSSKYLQAIANPHRRVAEVIVTLPGEIDGTELEILPDQSTVTMSGDDHSRYSASLALSPNLGSDYFELAATPGAVFSIRSGVQYSPGDVEWVDCGRLYAVDGGRGIAVGAFDVTLQDAATWLEETRFTSPWASPAGSGRIAQATAIVLGGRPGTTILTEGTESLMGSAVFERDRLDALDTISAGGNLDVAFDALGRYKIQDDPILTPLSPAWVLRTGEYGTILPDAKRTLPLSRLYNTVVVGAPEPFQTWGAVSMTIADPNHPRHASKIGVRPFFVSDPTITSLAAAQLRAQSTLTRLLTAVEEISIPTLGNPALEYGDTVAVVHEASETDPGLAANYFTEGWTFNLGTGAQDITARSTDQPELEES